MASARRVRSPGGSGQQPTVVAKPCFQIRGDALFIAADVSPEVGREQRDVQLLVLFDDPPETLYVSCSSSKPRSRLTYRMFRQP